MVPTAAPTSPEREPWSPRFTLAARTVAAAARSLGLAAPGFRSPPDVADASRTLRRWPDGRCIVAVRAAGRPESEVVADLVEGVVAANRLASGDARATRHELLALVERRLRDLNGV